MARPATFLTAALTLFAAACGLSGNSDVTADPYLTHGPVAEAPILVGCWTKLRIDTPEYIFPMIYARWDKKKTIPKNTVEEYANEVIAMIKAAPKTMPIWLQTHAYFGNYKPRDEENMIAHVADATREGTPGLWPDKGIEIWRARHIEFLRRLKEAGCRLDAWPLDNETNVLRWARNFNAAGPEEHKVWTNIVNDPRWKTKPIVGVGRPGAAFVTAEDLEKFAHIEKNPHKPGSRDFKQFENPRNMEAHRWINPLGAFMRAAVFNDVFYNETIKVYPNAAVSDYGKYHQKHKGEWGDPDVRQRIREVAPDLKYLPGVGNRGAVVLYGGRDDSVDRVKLSLDTVDHVLKVYERPELVTPWIAPPNNGKFRYDHEKKKILPSGKKPRFTDEEWEYMICELARRGIRHFLLWNAPNAGHDEKACEETMVRVFEKASRIAAERLREQAK